MIVHESTIHQCLNDVEVSKCICLRSAFNGKNIHSLLKTTQGQDMTKWEEI